ncbi:hypothetical protein ACFV0T_39820 [Streptomyces sp. NPDC059582]|uniref:hypothetical protein n=1 Tax=Streptomyces sp. NPDC059582 TaxID=3346875 RepID=UPI0036C4A8A4
MSKHWVYQFRNAPGRDEVEALTEEDVPRQILVRKCPGTDGLVDGYVLQHVVASARTAVYTWVRRGEPAPVAAYLLELLAEVCPQEICVGPWDGAADGEG